MWTSVEERLFVGGYTRGVCVQFDALGLRVDPLTRFVSGGVFFPVQVYGTKAT